MSAARIGVLGGTFNPIHTGHLRAAEEVCEALELERMLFVPSAEPPLKRGSTEVIASAKERLRWAQLATRDNPRFAVDPVELGREGPSYSVDTLRELRGRLGPEPPVFTIGQDAFVELPLWREPGTLLTLCHFAVMTRPPYEQGSLREWMPDVLAKDFTWAGDEEAHHRSAGTWVRRVPISALEISATDVRRRLREGRSVRYLLPEPVREAVLASGIYARNAT